MKKLYLFLGAATCLLASASGYERSEWKNNFSNQKETLNIVGRGECSVTNGVFRSKGSYACFGNPEWKIMRCLSRRVHQKMQNRFKFGLDFVLIIVLTVMWLV